jgi:hypothetical protein
MQYVIYFQGYVLDLFYNKQFFKVNWLSLYVQVALNLRWSNSEKRRFWNQEVKKWKKKIYILLLFITFYNFSHIASYTKSLFLHR